MGSKRKRLGLLLLHWLPALAAAERSHLVVTLGVFSMAGEHSMRALLRTTWMASPLACKSVPLEPRRNATALTAAAPQPVQDSTCVAHPLFVLGRAVEPETSAATRAALAAELEQHGDLLLLDSRENMDEGKIFDWFRLAPALYPGSDYIGRVDSDTYLDLRALLAQVQASPVEPFLCYGFALDSRTLQGIAWGTPTQRWFLSGEFVLMGRGLAAWLARQNLTRADTHGPSHTDDLLFGRYLTRHDGNGHTTVFRTCYRRWVSLHAGLTPERRRRCPFTHRLKSEEAQQAQHIVTMQDRGAITAADVLLLMAATGLLVAGVRTLRVRRR